MDRHQLMRLVFNSWRLMLSLAHVSGESAGLSSRPTPYACSGGGPGVGRGMADPPEDAAGHQALADVPLALDIPEDQVAIWSTGDSGRTWFHMVLVHQMETYGARWLGFTSDFRPQFVDLRAVRSVILIRAGPIPSWLRGNNWLGIADVTADELTVARRRCRALAALYGTSIGIPCCSRPAPPIRPAPR